MTILVVLGDEGGWEGTSVKAHPVAPIPLETQGIAQGGKLPTEACEATKPVNNATTTRIFITTIGEYNPGIT